MKKLLSAIALLAAGLSYGQIPGVFVADPNPSYHVISITEDMQGMTWLGTDGTGLFRYDGSSYVRFAPGEDEGTIPSGHVSALLSDSKGTLWVGTQTGITRLERGLGRFVRYQLDDNNSYVTRVLEDPSSRIFITTQTGLFLCDEASGSFHKVIPFKEGALISAIVSDYDSIWIVYSSGIERYDTSFKLLGAYPSPAPVRSAVFAEDGLMYLLGLSEVLCFDTDLGRFIPAPEALRSLKAGDMTAMHDYSGQGLILVDAESVHYYYDRQTQALLPESDPLFPYDAPHLGRLLFLYQGPSGVIWEVNTDGGFKSVPPGNTNPYRHLCRETEGVAVRDAASDGRHVWFIQDGVTLVTYDIASREIRRDDIGRIIGDRSGQQYYYMYWSKYYGRLFLYDSYTVYLLSVDEAGAYHVEQSFTKGPGTAISSITVDRRRTLWVSCQFDPDLYYITRGKPDRHLQLEKKEMQPELSNLYISALYTLRNGDIVAAYTDIGLAIIDANTGDVRYVKLSDKYKQMYIHSLYEDEQGRIWAGTSDIGLLIYDPATGTVEQPAEFERKNIRTIGSDTRGHTIFMHESTLYSYTPRTREFHTIWKTSDSAPDRNGRVFPFDDGYLLINSGRRFVAIEADASRSAPAPERFDVALSGDNAQALALFAAERFGAGIPRIRIPHTQRNLRLTVMAPNYSDTPLQYRYRSKGLTDGWQASFNEPTIALNNTSFGKHRIDLQVADVTGGTASQVESVVLQIRRPPFWSIAAMILYAALFLALVTAIFLLAFQANKRHLEAERIQKEKEFQEQMNQDNIDFFANMSHEFRTPLSIISAAVTTMENDPSNSPAQVRLERIIQRNSDRMLKLVSQMIDFNKLEHNKLPLSVQLTDANDSVREIVDIFSVGAEQKGISLSVEGADHPLLTWLDRDKFEKIMYNLLSNAMKFTPPHGSITVRSRVSGNIASDFPDRTAADGDYLVVEVADTGIGIPEDSLSLIFERFGQAFPSQKQGGTGIGLYFAKAMVEIHHGFIKAANDNGAVFTFAVPMSQSAYSDYERSAKEDSGQSLDNKRYLSEYTSRPEQRHAKTDTTILVIDDDYEIVYFLETILSPHYRVIPTFDAMNGYKMIESEEPDIVISDIMMYDTDGLQLCKMVKENINICHIPFILLTAKSTVANQIEGLNAGADSYIVKPFDPDYLLAVIGSLLRNRDNARKLLGSSTRVGKTLGEAISTRDKKLLETVYRLFEENLANTDINAADFAEECGISRTKFFYKVKALTGMTPTDYFRTYKLNRAAELLKEDKYKIAGIAEMCGFSSASHFAMSFKKQFGVLPSEYLDKA